VLTGTAPAFLHGSEQATQDIDLVDIGLGPAKQTPDAVHQMQATLRAITKPDFIHNLLQMRIEAL
jgi:hypothetical protein